MTDELKIKQVEAMIDLTKVLIAHQKERPMTEKKSEAERIKEIDAVIKLANVRKNILLAEGTSDEAASAFLKVLKHGLQDYIQEKQSSGRPSYHILKRVSQHIQSGIEELEGLPLDVRVPKS